MPITTSRFQDGRGLRIRISERFEFSDHEAFRAAYADGEPQHTRCSIDLSNTEYIDSAALGMLLVLRERAGGMHADITLTGFNHTIGQILRVSRFENLFKLDGSRAA